ncbi:putative ankyrin and het domain-containing protein [Neofusicoccum parvum UCRNP2]|uniref:Putative ankyrin and het domain-containing protein n=1 Tax=Botryosphaeria parva (strain UCR-NP2) TaxID=1287680 RepID=R1GCX9_BOTPV|nr:putative ankyrin and het domain-containing protein [Neofusicoccum parvum UCRNP2]
MQKDDGFKYQPLDPRLNEIRLIKLQPVPKPTDGAGYLPIINCTLRKASLEENPEYNALSYVWGDPHDTKPILLDGKLFHITVNLEAALRQLAADLRRRRSSHAWLWVDAVCIDQSDTAERTHQVCQMDQIYRHAAQVVVWLGPGSIDSDDAMATLERVCDVAQSSKTQYWVRSWPLFQFQEAPLPDTSTFYIQRALDGVLDALCADSHRELDAVASLYERPWFRRVWILQELALSRSAVLLCGRTRIEWGRFYAAFWMLCGLRDYLNAVPRAAGGGGSSLAVAAFLNAKLENVATVALSCILVSDETPLRQFLYFLGTNKGRSRLLASDERDYCFALLGLANDTHRLRVRADYEMTWRDVRMQLAKSCLMHYGLELLSYCSLSASQAPGDGDAAPSWVPDWASAHLPKALSAYSHLNQNIDESSFDAVGRLKLWGVRVDRVAQLGDTLPAGEISYKNDETFESLVVWLEALRRLLPEINDACGTEEKVNEALWRTPIADRAYVHNYETVRASQDLQTGYRDLFDGADVPFVLREAGDGCWRVVGEAYVHGIMDGELTEHWSVQIEQIQIV